MSNSGRMRRQQRHRRATLPLAMLRLKCLQAARLFSIARSNPEIRRADTAIQGCPRTTISRQLAASHERQVQLVPPGVWPGVKRALIASSPHAQRFVVATARAPSGTCRKFVVLATKRDTADHPRCGPPCLSAASTGRACGHLRAARRAAAPRCRPRGRSACANSRSAGCLRLRTPACECSRRSAAPIAAEPPSRRISPSARGDRGSRRALRYLRSTCCRICGTVPAVRSRRSQGAQALGGSGLEAGSLRRDRRHSACQRRNRGEPFSFTASARRRSSRRTGCRARSCATSARARAAKARTHGRPAARECAPRCHPRSSSRTRP